MKKKDTMVERIARKMCRDFWQSAAEEHRPRDLDAHVERDWPVWIKWATSALEAMPNPTPAMIAAKTYAAAIEVALAEPRPVLVRRSRSELDDDDHPTAHP